MTEVQLRTLIDSGNAPALEQLTIGSLQDRLVIDGLVAVQVELIDSSLSRGNDLDILDPAGNPIGLLCFCRGQPAEIEKMSKWRLAAYLTEITENEFNQPYWSRCDYAVIDEPRVVHYLANYAPTAPIWGGFSHRVQQVQYVRQVASLRIVDGIRIPTAHHGEAMSRAVGARHSFDRYLKFYHQLELLFDWVLVKRVQALGNDLMGIGQLMSAYSQQDFQRLDRLLDDYCTDTDRLLQVLISVVAHEPLAVTIFQDFGKEANPLKLPGKWDDFVDMAKSGVVTLQSFKTAKLASNAIDRDRLTRKIAAYWIYRIRCCIAHNRIGEYVLMEADEQFVVEFGEPLLKEVLVQVLVNPALPP
jgi:hypothetical protein